MRNDLMFISLYLIVLFFILFSIVEIWGCRRKIFLVFVNFKVFIFIKVFIVVFLMLGGVDLMLGGVDLLLILGVLI